VILTEGPQKVGDGDGGGDLLRSCLESEMSLLNFDRAWAGLPGYCGFGGVDVYSFG
jgi:hypothetical protein